MRKRGVAKGLTSSRSLIKLTNTTIDKYALCTKEVLHNRGIAAAAFHKAFDKGGANRIWREDETSVFPGRKLSPDDVLMAKVTSTMFPFVDFENT